MATQSHVTLPTWPVAITAELHLPWWLSDEWCRPSHARFAQSGSIVARAQVGLQWYDTHLTIPQGAPITSTPDGLPVLHELLSDEYPRDRYRLTIRRDMHGILVKQPSVANNPFRVR